MIFLKQTELKARNSFFFFYSLLCVMSQTPDSPNREAPPTGGSSALLAGQSDYSWPNAKILLSACREDKSSSCRHTQSCTASAPAADASHTTQVRNTRADFKLTCSKSPSTGGQVEGSWHTHMGVLLSSTSHTLPFLQW